MDERTSGARASTRTASSTMSATPGARWISGVSGFAMTVVPRALPGRDPPPLPAEQAHVEFLDVCRDRRLLAFSPDRAGSLNLWVMPADGGEPQQRTAHAASDWGPAWSPDCEEIAFHSDRSGNRDIWVVPLEPGPARPLT